MSTFWYPPNKGWGNAATVAKQKKQAAIKARNAATGVTGYDPYESAMKSTDQILAEMLAEVSRSKEAARAKAAQEAQLELDKGKALAYGIQQLGIPANIAAIFQNAAGNQANLAQGFSGNIRDEAAAQAAQQVQALAGTGQEGAVRNQGDNMGNVAYGLGGFIPGNELSTLGAAYGAQAALEPGFALQFGAINEAKRRQEWADELRKFGDQEADVLGKKPSLYRELLGDERTYESELYRRKVAQRDYDYKVWQDKVKAYIYANPQSKVVIRNNANGQQQAWDVTPGKVPHPVGDPVGPVKTTKTTTHTATVVKNGVPHTVVYDENWNEIKDLGPSKTKTTTKPSPSAVAKDVQKAYVAAVSDLAKDVTDPDVYAAVLPKKAAIAIKYGAKVTEYVSLEKARDLLFNRYWPSISAAGGGKKKRGQLLAAITRALRTAGFKSRRQ